MTQRVCGHLRKAHDPEPAEGERVRLLLESLGAWQLPGVRAMLCRCGVSTAYPPTPADARGSALGNNTFDPGFGLVPLLYSIR